MVSLYFGVRISKDGAERPLKKSQMQIQCVGVE